MRVTAMAPATPLAPAHPPLPLGPPPPPLPAETIPTPWLNYWTEVGHAHGRWGGTKSYKYAVPAPAIDLDFLARWAHDRFKMWCELRGVDRRIPGLSAAPVVKCLAGLQPYVEYDFVMGGGVVPDGVEIAEIAEVFHGTYMTSLWNILEGGRLCESTGTNGSEMRTYTPGVYTSQSEMTAARYAWPCNVLKDNLFYGVMFVLRAKGMPKTSWHKKDEYLYAGSMLDIKRVRLLLNIDVAKGQARCPEWSPRLELTPPGRQGVDGSQEALTLTPSTIFRRHCWY